MRRNITPQQEHLVLTASDPIADYCIANKLAPAEHRGRIKKAIAHQLSSPDDLSMLEEAERRRTHAERNGNNRPYHGR